MWQIEYFQLSFKLLQIVKQIEIKTFLQTLRLDK